MQVVTAHWFTCLAVVNVYCMSPFGGNKFLQHVYVPLEIFLIAGLNENADDILICRLETDCCYMILERERWLHLWLTTDGLQWGFYAWAFDDCAAKLFSLYRGVGRLACIDWMNELLLIWWWYAMFIILLLWETAEYRDDCIDVILNVVVPSNDAF